MDESNGPGIASLVLADDYHLDQPTRHASEVGCWKVEPCNTAEVGDASPAADKNKPCQPQYRGKPVSNAFEDLRGEPHTQHDTDDHRHRGSYRTWRRNRQPHEGGQRTGCHGAKHPW